MPHPPYVDALLQSEAYMHEWHRPAAVQLVETHVSYLFMADGFVYKVKKAVDLGFLDFTLLETRKHYCDEELRLNRRYSPDVYLDVVPVTQDGRRITLNGPGETIDYAVKMRQLPREHMLDARLQAGAVSTADVQHIARRIAAVHAEAERMPPDSPYGGWVAFSHHVEENIAQTAEAPPEVVAPEVLEDIAAYSRAFLEAKRSLFDRRAAEGRVVDGHGDLHAGQICLADGVEFIDCLEFSPEYRRGDVAADLAFLAMDLDHFGRHDLSVVLVDAYIGESGDQGIRPLLDFFKCYRAHVRAKVTLLKAETAGLAGAKLAEAIDEAKAYFTLARSYALAALPSPALYVAMGLPGTGKSTIAKALAERWGMPAWSSDIERKRLFGMQPADRDESGVGKGIYGSGIGRRVHGRLFELAEADLRAGRSVVLDATFGHGPYREQAAKLAKDAGAAVWFIESVLPPDEVRRRIEARQKAGADPSDASWQVYQAHLRGWNPVATGLADRHIRVDTSAFPAETLQATLRELFIRSLA